MLLLMVRPADTFDMHSRSGGHHKAAPPPPPSKYQPCISTLKDIFCPQLVLGFSALQCTILAQALASSFPLHECSHRYIPAIQLQLQAGLLYCAHPSFSTNRAGATSASRSAAGRHHVTQTPIRPPYIGTQAPGGFPAHLPHTACNNKGRPASESGSR